jgi:hypothetical protein
MSNVVAMPVCECCGQPLRKARAARKPAASFRGYDDFVVAYNAARHAAIAELGQAWYLVPGASVWARVPNAWVACKVYGRTSTAPRDRRLPAAQFWPSGELPTGPEYAAPAATIPPCDYRVRLGELAGKHRKMVADMRAGWDLCRFTRGQHGAIYLGELARIRRDATLAARSARFAEAA